MPDRVRLPQVQFPDALPLLDLSSDQLSIKQDYLDTPIFVESLSNYSGSFPDTYRAGVGPTWVVRDGREVDREATELVAPSTARICLPHTVEGEGVSLLLPPRKQPRPRGLCKLTSVDSPRGRGSFVPKDFLGHWLGEWRGSNVFRAQRGTGRERTMEREEVSRNDLGAEGHSRVTCLEAPSRILDDP